MSKQHTAVRPPHPPPLPAVLDGLWFVSGRSGVVSMTLDELDEAFQRGDVCAGTRVFTSGMEAWQTLGVLAHLDDAAFREAGPPAPASSMPAPPQPITGVQRSPGRLPFALRRALARLVDGMAAVGRHRRPLAVLGVWALGAVLWLLFFVLPPRLAALPAATSTKISAAAPSLQPQADTTRVTVDESIPVLHPTQLQLAAPIPEPTSPPRAASTSSQRQGHAARKSTSRARARAKKQP